MLRLVDVYFPTLLRTKCPLFSWAVRPGYTFWIAWTGIWRNCNLWNFGNYVPNDQFCVPEELNRQQHGCKAQTFSQDSFIWTSTIDPNMISSEKDCSFLLDYKVIFPKHNVKNTRFVGLESDCMNFYHIAFIELQWLGETALKPICNNPTTKLLSHIYR